MSGIYIPGMEMPKSCADCFAEQCIGSDFGCGVIGFEDGNTTCFTKDRRKDCPLVEVPPHGRLIDANPIMKFIQDGLNNGEFGYDQIKVMGEIQYAPTIIESEE